MRSNCRETSLLSNPLTASQPGPCAHPSRTQPQPQRPSGTHHPCVCRWRHRHFVSFISVLRKVVIIIIITGLTGLTATAITAATGIVDRRRRANAGVELNSQQRRRRRQRRRQHRASKSIVTMTSSTPEEQQGQTMSGRLKLYRSSPSRLVAFVSGPDPPLPTGGTVVFIPGLTDGMMGLGYVPALAAELESRGWALVQPVLSSSYLGFGVSSLARDVEELDALLGGGGGGGSGTSTDDSGPAGGGRIVLIGHSTGCQDIGAYLKNGAERGRVVGAVMQGAVSDREAFGMECGEDVVAEAAARAEAMVRRGEGEQLMPRDTPGVFNTPITASRYASLAGRMTPDDMFSSDLSDEELAAQIGHMTTAGGAASSSSSSTSSTGPPQSGGVHLLWAFSGSDEYVPDAVKENYEAHAARIARAAGAGGGSGANESSSSSRHVIVEGGNHSCDGDPGTEFVKLVGEFLQQLPLPR